VLWFQLSHMEVCVTGIHQIKYVCCESYQLHHKTHRTALSQTRLICLARIVFEPREIVQTESSWVRYTDCSGTTPLGHSPSSQIAQCFATGRPSATKLLVFRRFVTRADAVRRTLRPRPVNTLTDSHFHVRRQSHFSEHPFLSPYRHSRYFSKIQTIP
jgi:hypothetical protein